MMKRLDPDANTFEIDRNGIEAIKDEYRCSKGRIEKRLIEIMNNEARSAYEALYDRNDKDADE